MAVWRGVGLAVLVLLGVAIAVMRGVDDWRKRPVRAELHVPPAFALAREFDFGRYRLAWHGRGFSVHLIDRPDKTLWAVEGGFLAAGVGAADASGDGSGRELRDERQLLCREQSLETFERAGGRLQLKGHLRCADGSVSAYALTLEDDGERGVVLAVRLDSPRLNRLYLTWKRGADERFFGFGEVSGAYDLAGRRLAIFPRSDSHPEQGGLSAVATQATYLTSGLRAFHSQSAAYQVFDLRDPNRVGLEVHDGRLIANIFRGDSLDELRTRQSSVVGALPKPSLAK